MGDGAGEGESEGDGRGVLAGRKGGQRNTQTYDEGIFPSR